MVDIIAGFIFAMIPIALIVFEMIESWNSNKRNKEMQDIIRKLEHYAFEMSKMKEVSIKDEFPIVDEEPFEYTIILWWGLDGIRLNKDGTTEWIRRGKKIEDERVPVPQIVTSMPRYPTWPCYNPLYNAAAQINRMNLCNDMQASQNAMNWIQRSIIENQIQASQTRIAQLQQLNAMCQNAIIPSDTMNYLVARKIDECCCKKQDK